MNDSIKPAQRESGSLPPCWVRRRPWGFSPEARRGSQGASRAAPGDSMDVSLSELRELLMNREAWRAAIHIQSLLQGIFLTQGLNPSLLHCR